MKHKENWMAIKGYENLYEVSDMGRIRSSKDKITKSKLHGDRKWKQRIIKQKIGKDNSCRVILYKDKKPTTFLVHRLVAINFLEGIDGKEYINHKDGNRLNNFVSNLEWCNHEENNNHAFDNGLMPNNKFIVLEDLTNGELIKFSSYTKAGKFLGRNPSYISKTIKNGDYIVDHYAIYLTGMKNIERIIKIQSHIKTL